VSGACDRFTSFLRCTAGLTLPRRTGQYNSAAFDCVTAAVADASAVRGKKDGSVWPTPYTLSFYLAGQARLRRTRVYLTELTGARLWTRDSALWAPPASLGAVIILDRERCRTDLGPIWRERSFPPPEGDPGNCQSPAAAEGFYRGG